MASAPAVKLYHDLACPVIVDELELADVPCNPALLSQAGGLEVPRSVLLSLLDFAHIVLRASGHHLR